MLTLTGNQVWIPNTIQMALAMLLKALPARMAKLLVRWVTQNAGKPDFSKTSLVTRTKSSLNQRFATLLANNTLRNQNDLTDRQAHNFYN